MEALKNEMRELQSAFDLQEVLKRMVKYVIEGMAVAGVAYYVPKKKLNLEEIVMIGLTAACTFALLDMFAPSIGNTARQGAGFGIGANLVGFPAAV